MSQEYNSEVSYNEEEEETESEWEPLLNHPNYEICKQYPYQIRRARDRYILKETLLDTGYLQVWIDGKKYRKHRLISLQFIPNPDNLPQIDHINHCRTDNRIENLRWTSPKQNCNNLGKTPTGREVEYVQTLPDDSFLVETYSKWTFDDLFYCINTDRFYVWNGINYRVIEPILKGNTNSYVINATDIDNKKHLIYYTKFKRQYNLI